MSESALTGAELRRARNRREMRDAILDEASRIVAHDGLEALSLRAIARNLGYSPGALYEYFRDKDAIIHGLYFKGADGLGVVLSRTLAGLPPETSVPDQLRALAHAYRAHALANPDLFRLGLSMVMCVDDLDVDPDDPAFQGGYPILLDTIARGQEQGVLVDAPASHLVAAAWSIVHGFVALELTNHLTGGEQFGQPPANVEDGMARRNDAFESVLSIYLDGITRQ